MDPTLREVQAHSESEGGIISLTEKKRKRTRESIHSEIAENEGCSGNGSGVEEKNIEVKKSKTIIPGLASVGSSPPPPSTIKPRRVAKACVACSKGRRKCVDPKGPDGCKGCRSRGIQCQIPTDSMLARPSAETTASGDDSTLLAVDTTMEPPRDPLTNAKMYNYLKNVELKEHLVLKGFDGDMLPSGKRLTRQILLNELYKFDEKEGLPKYPHTSWTSLKPATSAPGDAKALAIQPWEKTHDLQLQDSETHFTMQSLSEPRHRNLVCTQCKVNFTINKSCDIGVPCSRCKDLGLECTYPKHVYQYWQTHFRAAKDIDFTRINDWDGVHGDGVSIGVDVKPENVVQPSTQAVHYLVITVARLSSGDNSAIMALLRKGPRVGLMWRGLLRVGNRGVRYSEPSGIARFGYIAFCRQGTISVPITHGYMSESASGLALLRAWVNVFNEIMVEGNTNLPTEIHVVLFGFAGFGVNIGAWREFLDCVEAWDAKEKTAGRTHVPKLADRIFLVPSVEPEVVDGTATYSLVPGKDLCVDAEAFEGFADKCWGKFRLTSLHRRAVFHSFNKANVNAELPELSYQVIDPIWDDVEKNDIFLEALDQEYRHRSAALSSATIPTHKNVQNRNLTRNRF